MKSLDDYLPSYDFAVRHEVRVAADPARVDRALREVTYGEIPVVRGLLFARGLGIRGTGDRVVETMVPRATVLEDVPGEGIVLTLSGQFWRLPRLARDPLDRDAGPHPRSVVAEEVRALLADRAPV
jgi:hypothetical protein